MTSISVGGKSSLNPIMPPLHIMPFASKACTFDQALVVWITPSTTGGVAPWPQLVAGEKG
jgi:hypothetical protein